MSFRLTVALALLHLPLEVKTVRRPIPRRRSKLSKTLDGSRSRGPNEEIALAPFMALVNGQSGRISAENEHLCQESLLQICDMLSAESERAIAELGQNFPAHALHDMLSQLWRNEAWFVCEIRKQIREKHNDGK